MQACEECYVATPDAVAMARSQVVARARRAGASRAQLEDIRLAVSEAVTNAVQHGYRGGPGKVWVSTQAGAGQFVVVVRDRGVGIAAPPAENRRGLGCGLRIIRGVADATEVGQPLAGGTELRMRFSLGAPTPALVLAA